MTKVDYKIGESLNLLYGLRPFAPSHTDIKPFFSTSKEPLSTYDIKAIQDDKATWEMPTVSLHENVDELCNHLFEYNILPFKWDVGSFSLPLSKLMLGDHDRQDSLTTLGNYIGVDLNKDYAFMLVKMKRKVGEAFHEVTRESAPVPLQIKWHYTKAGKWAMMRLRIAHQIIDRGMRDALITTKQAKDYLKFFDTYGTHFISGIEYGDIIFQVFAYHRSKFDEMKNHISYEAIGSNTLLNDSLEYQYFTSSEWVDAYGGIVSQALDSNIAKTISENRWMDDRYAQTNTIFGPFQQDLEALINFFPSFSKTAPIGLELSDISHFMKSFRFYGYQRLLKGALLQKYAPGISLPYVNRTLANWPQLLDHIGFPSSVGNAKTIIQQEILASRDLRFTNPEVINTLNVYNLALWINHEEPLYLPGKSIRFFTYELGISERNGKYPLFILEDEAFDDFEFICGNMKGILIFRNRSYTKQQIIIDGFRFETTKVDENTGRYSVALKGEVIHPNESIIREAIPFIKQSIPTIRAILAHKKEDQEFAHGYLEWINFLLDKLDDEQELKLVVLYLSRVWNQMNHSITSKEKLGESSELTREQNYKEIHTQIGFYRQDIVARKFQEIKSRNLGNKPEIHNSIAEQMIRTDERITPLFQEISSTRKALLQHQLSILHESNNENQIKQLQVKRQKVLHLAHEIKAIDFDQESYPLIHPVLDIATAMFDMDAKSIKQVELPYVSTEDLINFSDISYRILNQIILCHASSKIIEENDTDYTLLVQQCLGGLGGKYKEIPEVDWMKSIELLSKVMVVLSETSPNKALIKNFINSYEELLFTGKNWLTEQLKRMTLYVDLFYSNFESKLSQEIIKKTNHILNAELLDHSNNVNIFELAEIFQFKWRLAENMTTDIRNASKGILEKEMIN